MNPNKNSFDKETRNIFWGEIRAKAFALFLVNAIVLLFLIIVFCAALFRDITVDNLFLKLPRIINDLKSSIDITKDITNILVVALIILFIRNIIIGLSRYFNPRKAPVYRRLIKFGVPIEELEKDIINDIQIYFNLNLYAGKRWLLIEKFFSINVINVNEILRVYTLKSGHFGPRSRVMFYVSVILKNEENLLINVDSLGQGDKIVNYIESMMEGNKFLEKLKSSETMVGSCNMTIQVNDMQKATILDSHGNTVYSERLK
jgi:hypothetical protein